LFLTRLEDPEWVTWYYRTGSGSDRIQGWT